MNAGSLKIPADPPRCQAPGLFWQALGHFEWDLNIDEIPGKPCICKDLHQRRYRRSRARTTMSGPAGQRAGGSPEFRQGLRLAAPVPLVEPRVWSLRAQEETLEPPGPRRSRGPELLGGRFAHDAVFQRLEEPPLRPGWFRSSPQGRAENPLIPRQYPEASLDSPPNLWDTPPAFEKPCISKDFL